MHELKEGVLPLVHSFLLRLACRRDHAHAWSMMCVCEAAARRTPTTAAGKADRRCRRLAVVAGFAGRACPALRAGAWPHSRQPGHRAAQLFLSAASLDAAVTTAKSSEVNVAVPGATPDADLVEHALPEQFTSSYQDGRFVTVPVSHSGG